MNKAFKLLILVALFLQSEFLPAQNFGIKGGMNLATMLSKDNDNRYSDNFSANSGIHFGFTFEFPLNDVVALSPEILLTNKGLKYDFTEDDSNISSDIKLYYIDVPVMLKTRYNWGNDKKIVGATGPYLGMGVSGQSQTTTEYQGERVCEKKDVKWGSNKSDDFKKLDWGWSFAGGIQIEEVELSLSYDLGFANIAANQENGTIARNRVVKISIAYQFGK